MAETKKSFERQVKNPVLTKTTVEENQSWTEFRQLRTDFIKKNDRGKEYRTGFNSEYNKEKWEFTSIAKKHDGVKKYVSLHEKLRRKSPMWEHF